MLLYPPGKLYQRSEDRCQTSIDDSAAGSVHACNDLGYIASVLRNEGYAVFLRDYQTERRSFDDVVEDVGAFAPDMIFLSTTNGTVFGDLRFINDIVGIRKCRTVIKGAIFFDTDPDMLADLDLSNVDCAVGGEVEFVIARIAAALLRGEGKMDDIPGIIFKTGDGLKKTRFGCFENDLDSLPFPARDLMNNSLYLRPDTGEMMATIATSRGCPSNCIYCLTPRISGKRLRRRSVENIFAEITECFHTYGIKNFFFKSDTFTLDNAFAGALCDRIISSELRGKIEFTANGRADTLSPELLRKMKDAGCFMLAVGFESGSERSLKLMKKGTDVENNLEAAKMIKAAGVPLFGFFMIGFPWETAEDIKATKKLIMDIDPDFIEVHIAMPYIGTGLFDLCRETGVLEGDSFGGNPYDPSITGTKTISKSDLQKIKNKILLSFYLRPKYLLRRGKECLKDPKLFGRYASYGLRLVGRAAKKAIGR